MKQLLIHWKDKDIAEATCEDDFTIRSQFPNVRLEGKSDLQGGGSDRVSVADLGLDEQEGIQGSRPKIWKVYERKNRRLKGNGEVAERGEAKGE